MDFIQKQHRLPPVGITVTDYLLTARTSLDDTGIDRRQLDKPMLDYDCQRCVSVILSVLSWTPEDYRHRAPTASRVSLISLRSGPPGFNASA